MLATYWHACMHPRKLNINSRNSSEHLYLQIPNPLKISIHRTCTLILLLTLTDQQSSSWISHVCSMVPDSTLASLHSPYHPLHHTDIYMYSRIYTCTLSHKNVQHRIGPSLLFIGNACQIRQGISFMTNPNMKGGREGGGLS